MRVWIIYLVLLFIILKAKLLLQAVIGWKLEKLKSSTYKSATEKERLEKPAKLGWKKLLTQANPFITIPMRPFVFSTLAHPWGRER